MTDTPGQPPYVGTFLRRKTADELWALMNFQAEEAKAVGANRNNRYYVVERHWPFWKVAKYYRGESNE